MTLTGISGRGLAVIAMLVAILWGCIFAERAIIRQARQETLQLRRSRPVTPVLYPVKQRRPASPVAAVLPAAQRDLEV